MAGKAVGQGGVSCAAALPLWRGAPGSCGKRRDRECYGRGAGGGAGRAGAVPPSAVGLARPGWVLRRGGRAWLEAEKAWLCRGRQHPLRGVWGPAARGAVAVSERGWELRPGSLRPPGCPDGRCTRGPTRISSASPGSSAFRLSSKDSGEGAPWHGLAGSPRTPRPREPGDSAAVARGYHGPPGACATDTEKGELRSAGCRRPHPSRQGHPEPRLPGRHPQPETRAAAARREQ